MFKITTSNAEQYVSGVFKWYCQSQFQLDTRTHKCRSSCSICFNIFHTLLYIIRLLFFRYIVHQMLLEWYHLMLKLRQKTKHNYTICMSHLIFSMLLPVFHFLYSACEFSIHLVLLIREKHLNLWLYAELCSWV